MDNKDTKWMVREPRSDLSGQLARALNISPLVSQLLVNRGIDSADQAELFLSAKLRDLHSPFLMKDMEKAVVRVIRAMQQNEKICIFGDYDADGITATSVLVLFLRQVGAQVSYYIPSRISEGYGLNPGALKAVRKTGVSLIITVDCGVSDHGPITYANTQGLDVIVTDHHVTPEKLAPAYAVLNPKQPGCEFPFKGLAGVGVAFNLVMGLRKALRDQSFWQETQEPNLKDYLDLVAMGTIADIVPMVDENRIFVRNGLGMIAEGRRPGVKALKLVSGVTNGDVTASLVAYRMAPRMNAAGRLSDAGQSVQLMLCENAEEALRLARKIDEENTLRQKIERRILAEARALIQAGENLPDALVFASEDWHPGVVGLCASRLSEEFNRPAILIALDRAKGEGRGSARSIQGFDIYSGIKQCEGLLKAFGGHKGAAGLTIGAEKVDAFRAMFCGIVEQEIRQHDFTPIINIDAEIPLGQLSYDVLEEIEALAPFGPDNPEPVFSSGEIKYYSSMIVGTGHLKLKIKEDGRFFDAIGFNMGSRYCLKDEAIRMAFVPQFNFYNGEKSIQLNLKDIKN